MLVPCAPTMNNGEEKQPMSRLVWLHAAHTKTSRPAGRGSGGPKELLPPGAPTLIAERPKFVKYAGASTLVKGPVRARLPLGLKAFASARGPVAATQITDGVLQKVEYVLPSWSRSLAAFPADTTTVTPLLRAKLNTLLSNPTKRPLPAFGKAPPRLMLTTSAPLDRKSTRLNSSHVEISYA